MLALAPGDDATLDAHGRDSTKRAATIKRMLATLERDAAARQGAQAAAVLARMAEVAEQRLGDSERASELLSRAVDVGAREPEHLEALCALYERGERYDDLVELLRERVLMERIAQARIELYRRIALVLRDRLDDAEGAYDAWEHLLELTEDREALTALQQRARDRDDAAALVDILGRLAALEPDPAGEARPAVRSRAPAQRAARAAGRGDCPISCASCSRSIPTSSWRSPS